MDVALVYNPAAGIRWSRRPGIEAVREALRAAAGRVLTFPTRGPGDGITQGRAAAESVGSGVVAVYGGDGTVNEALNGVVEAGGSATVLLLPGGTVNVLARDLKIPLHPLKAARLLAQGKPRTIYLGRASWPDGGRYFALMAGAGLDASVVYRMLSHRLAKSALGPWAFVLEGLRHAVRYPFPEIRVSADEGAEVSGYFAVVGKAPGYAGWLSVTPAANLAEPRFQVAVSTGRRSWRYFYYLGLALAGRLERSRDFVFLQARRVRMAGRGTVRVQVDGEYAGLLPMEFFCDGTAVRILTPL